MNQPCLPMATLGRVRFGVQGPGEIWKIERNHGSGQPGAGVRPEPLVWLIHIFSNKRLSNQVLVTATRREVTLQTKAQHWGSRPP